MTHVCEETRTRIRLSVAAYAYEMENDSIMSDAEFDSLSLTVDPRVTTGNKKLDAFFREHFEPDTGVWVRQHPEPEKLRDIYFRLKEPPLHLVVDREPRIGQCVLTC